MSDMYRAAKFERSSSAETAPTASSFVTACGSRYRYDEERRATRQDPVSGEMFPRHDVTIFVQLTECDHERYVAMLDTEDYRLNIYQRGLDGTLRRIRHLSKVTGPDRLMLAVVERGSIRETIPASLQPEVGYQVFETSTHYGSERTHTERHFGDVVTEVSYE